MPLPTDVSFDMITFEHNHDRPMNKKLPGRKLLLFCVCDQSILIWPTFPFYALMPSML